MPYFEDMTERKPVDCWLTDMDGILVHEQRAIPGAAEFIGVLQQCGRRFLVLTNNSILGLRLLITGQTRTYSFEAITRAIRLIEKGARFIATNPDATGPSPDGPLLATGSVAALITRATGITPYYVGEPNPLIMRSALNQIEAHSESTVMIGDRMNTDVLSGIEAGLRTVLVLTGSTKQADIASCPYRPTQVVDSIAELVQTAAELSDSNTS